MMSDQKLLNVFQKIALLKSQSGSHSPSIDTLLKEVPEIDIKVDACFLSNPYATDLFLEHLRKDLILTNDFRNVLEYYPPQNAAVAGHIQRAIGVDAANIFVGNGAIEIIQALLHNFVSKKICVILPTFSSYYEFVKPHHEVIYYNLNKENDFQLNVSDYIRFVKENKPDTIVIINPNNPNGGYISKEDLTFILENLKEVDNIIIDESFIHFAYESSSLGQVTVQDLIATHKNLSIIKSMSKDFGIAGIRAGYCILAEDKIKSLLRNGYLWNISGLANYFFKKYGDPAFVQAYEVVRKKYILNTQAFLSDLSAVQGIKVYPSKANFALMEILVPGLSSFDFAIELLVKHGIYVRDCSDKIGLQGQFVRVASRSFEDNLTIVEGIKQILKDRL